MKIGSSTVYKVYVGSSPVLSIYKGADRVFSGYETETSALLARMSVQPSTPLANLINKTIKDLKDAGIWTKLDCLWMFNMHDQQAATLNWIKASHDATLINSPTFLPKIGFIGNGTSSCINLNFDISIGVNYTLNNCSTGCMLFKQPSATKHLYGCRWSLYYTSLFYYPNNWDYPLSFHLNQTGAGYSSFGLNHGALDSLIVLNRDNSSEQRGFIRGSNKLTFTGKTAGNAFGNMYALAINDYGSLSGYGDHGLSLLFFGASLTDQQNADFATIIKYYTDNVSSAIGGYDKSSDLLFYNMTEQPTTALKSLIDTTIKGLKSDGIWDKADTLYIRGVHTAQAATLNWIKNMHNGTLVNSPTFTPKIGFKGDGATNYIYDNYACGYHKQFCKKGDATVSIITKELGSSLSYIFGAYRSTGAQALAIYFRPAGNETVYLFSIADFNQLNFSTNNHYTIVNNNVNIRGYSNGVLTGSPGTISVYNEPIYNQVELGWNNAGTPGSFYNGNVAFSFNGGSLSSTEVSNLYNRIQYFYDNVNSTF